MLQLTNFCLFVTLEGVQKPHLNVLHLELWASAFHQNDSHSVHQFMFMVVLTISLWTYVTIEVCDMQKSLTSVGHTVGKNLSLVLTLHPGS